jgi:hypothetical protein
MRTPSTTGAALRLGLAVTAGMIVAACAETVAPEPLVVQVAAGADQEAEAGSLMRDPLVVTVLGLDSVPRRGVVVEWDVVEGGGFVVPQTDLTDVDGRAETSWTLGAALGDQAVRATADGETVTFNGWATPPLPSDWAAVLDFRPEAQVDNHTLHASMWVVNHWPGTLRLWTPHSCLAEGYPALYAAGGERVAGPATGCWTVPATWSIARADSLHAEWDLDIRLLSPGQYTLVIRLAVSEINGEPATLPAVEAAVTIGN